MQMLGNNWQIVEDNTKESFRLAKNDIINFGIQLAKVQQAQRQLAEEVGEIKSRPKFIQGGTQKVDLSGVTSGIDNIQREIDSLRDNQAGHAAVEADVKDLRKRYEQLVSVTKDLIKALEHNKAQPKIIQKVIRVVQKKPKIIKIAAKRHWVGSTATLRVHDKHCPFARNIKRKTKITFKSRMTAFKKGYKACKCLK